MVMAGVTPILFYDPAERVVATLHPNHTFQKVVFDPWQQTTWDVNDTVLIADPKTDADVGSFFDRLPETDYLPTWYDLRIDPAKALEEWPDVDREGRAHPENAHIRSAEASAAKKAAKHAGTPTVAYLDSLGRTFLTIADNGDAGNYETRVELDIEGNQRSAMDALGRVVMTYDYDLLSGRIHQASMDAGERWMLNDVTGKPIYGWDSRGYQLHHQYDAVRRPTKLTVTYDSIERLAEQVIYGEGQVNDTQLNLRGKAYQQWDGAGIVTNESYDFKGNLLNARRQFLQNYKDDVDWSKSPALEDESFASSTTYDALNRSVTLTTPDQSVMRPSYNEANLLNAVEVNLQGQQEDGESIWTNFVKNIDYNEKGQREVIEYGNDVKTSYAYDLNTFRLTHLLTIRGGAQSRLQDLRYTYDPAGNITKITDSAQQTIYFDNQVVSPTANYVYDAIYRLIAADGREHIGQVTTPQPTWDDKFRVNLPHPNEGQAMRRYSEEYQYDAVGNIEQAVHYLGSLSNSTNPSGSVAWKRTYAYDEPNEIPQNNRLTSTTIGTPHAKTIHKQYTYDAHGNMTAMPHLSEMNWDFKDQLQRVNLGGGGTAYYVYDAAGQRVRKVIERQNGTCQKERFYLSGVEVYREYDGSAKTITVERETLHIMDDQQRIAVIETRTQGDDSSPTQLIRFQHGNHLGSATLELDNQGSIISYEEYYPYGSTSYQAGRSAAEVGLKRYRYTGKERDEESGLYYHGVRYYASWLGRWTSVDPAIVSGKGGQRFEQSYQYVENRPVVALDPDGGVVWFAVIGIVAIASLTIVSDANAPENEEQARNAKPSISEAEFATRTAVVGLSWFTGGGAGNAILKGTGSKILAGAGGGLVGGGIGAPGDLLVSDLFGGEMSSASDYGEHTLSGIVAGAVLGGLFGAGSRILFGPAKPPPGGFGWHNVFGKPPVSPPPLPKTWQDFLPQAEERLAESYAKYGGRGVLNMAPKSFPNQQPELLPQELDLARQLGVKPIKPSDPGFEEIANSGRIKWAVTEEGELLTVPHTVEGQEISHAVITGGKPAIAAGEADIVVGGGVRFGTEITPRSGHFLYGSDEATNTSILELGKAFFRRFGVEFPK